MLKTKSHNHYYFLSFNCSGYMAPEYAMEGLYSTKSDVFSYGVLTLEIISGKRNNHYHVASPWLNLIGHVSKIYYHFFFFESVNFTVDISSMIPLHFQAWDLWMEGKALDIVDSSLGQAYPTQKFQDVFKLGFYVCKNKRLIDQPW